MTTFKLWMNKHRYDEIKLWCHEHTKQFKVIFPHIAYYSHVYDGNSYQIYGWDCSWRFNSKSLATIGILNEQDWYDNTYEIELAFDIPDKDQALLFKITWGGKI
jgi:hypothetical protein